jgi:thiamine-phosphate diphosphorylase
VSLPPPIRKLRLCYVTDRKALACPPSNQVPFLLEKIELAARAGVDWIQIREKDLSGRELAALVERAVQRVPSSCRILVNDRLDVAMVAGAAGVHLGEQSLPVEAALRFVRERKLREGFSVGVSAHSLESVKQAEKLGASCAIFGPVFTTPSKAGYGPPQGLQRLAEVCEKVAIPVIAIGGIAEENAKQCAAAGASGIAAIRMFQESADLASLVQELRQV